MPPLYAPKLNQPMSSPMMTTMFGFLAAVCADASPLNAKGTTSAVVLRSFLNIEPVLFNLIDRLTAAFHVAKTGPTGGVNTFDEKYSPDQLRRALSKRAVQAHAIRA